MLSDIATTEVHARAAHLLNGFDANSAVWKNHRWFSFKLPWARAKLPPASEVKNASISSGPAMTEGYGETRISKLANAVCIYTAEKDKRGHATITAYWACLGLHVCARGHSCELPMGEWAGAQV